MSRNSKSKAYKTQDTPNAGRILVATRPIKRQEKILTDEASVVAPIVFCGQVNLEPNFYCITCFKNCVGNKKCPKCRLPICDKACAKNKVHLEDCPVLRDMFDDEDEDKSVVPTIEERFQHLVLAASCLGKLTNIFKMASVASMTSDVKMSPKKDKFIEGQCLFSSFILIL